MKTIFKPDIIKSIFPNRENVRPNPLESWKSRHAASLNATSLVAFVAALLGFLTLHKSDWFFVELAWVGFVVYLYASTLVIAKSLQVTRVLADSILVEEQSLELKWRIANCSTHSIYNLSIFDHFGPSQNPAMEVNNEEIVSSTSQIFLSQKVKCDGGMGKRHLGPMRIEIRDPFGIFTFGITFDQVIEVQVLPKIKLINELQLHPRRDDSNFGQYETHSVGQNINFSGVREFRFGDSLRHIAWRLSARQNKLLVKDFEKNTDCSVGVVMNLDPNFQVGRRVNSTWELSRDTALSIVSQNLKQGHRVGFLSNFMLAMPGHSETHFSEICNRVSAFDFLDDSGEQSTNETEFIESAQLFRKAVTFFSLCQTIFLVTPLSRKIDSDLLEFALTLRSKGVDVHFVFIDTRAFMNEIPAEMKIDFLAMSSAQSPEEIRELVLKLLGIGAYSYLLGPRESFDFEKNFLKVAT